MAIMLGKLYDALRSGQGISDTQAREAAEEVASFEHAVADLRSDLRVLRWMLGAVLVLVSGLFWQGFTIMGRLP